MRRVGPVAIVAALLAGAIHAWFFVLESVLFMRPTVFRRFGLTTEADAQIVRSFAYNQGFYNVFLTVGVVIGLALVATGDIASGRVLVLFACGSMIAAGVVLVLHNPRFARAAAIQVVPPLVAVLAILAGA
jgi:putative membrane protein